MGQPSSKDTGNTRAPRAGAKSGGPVTHQDQAILDLKRARDRLKRYQKKLDIETTQLEKNAVSLMKAGRRDRALLCVKLKRLKEREADKADEQLLNLMQLVSTVEWETQQASVLEGLRAGNAALDALHKNITVEGVEALMEETAEAQALVEQISGVLAAGSGVEDAADEDLLAELRALQTELDGAAQAVAPTLSASGGAVGAAPAAPAAPASSANTADLRALESRLPLAPTGSVVSAAASKDTADSAAAGSGSRRIAVPG